MRIFIFLFLVLQLNFSYAQVEFREFKAAGLEARYNVLIDELRCLVCQNQTLKDSNSDLAKDMRNKVFDMIESGNTNKQIAAHMVERYGDFVLYNPPFKAATLLLWLGPLAFLIIAIFSVVRLIKGHNKDDSIAAISNDEHQRAEALLESVAQKKDKTA